MPDLIDTRLQGEEPRKFGSIFKSSPCRASEGAAGEPQLSSEGMEIQCKMLEWRRRRRWAEEGWGRGGGGGGRKRGEGVGGKEEKQGREEEEEDMEEEEEEAATG